MNQEYKKEIEEIIDGMKCPLDFKCYSSGLEFLCKAKVILGEPFLLCLEKEPQGCTFLSVKEGYLCKWPLRIYIANKLKK